MRIFVTGGSGMLGSAVSLYLKDCFEVYSSYTANRISIKGCKMSYLDITNPKETFESIQKINPDVIIHSSALVGINACEKNPELAHEINVRGTKNIAQASKKTNAKLVYISTDYVFDGIIGMYDEEAKTNPINVYGKTKLEGERFIDVNKNLIVRTSIYGWNIVKNKKSFSTWVIGELGIGNKINVFDDQYNSMMLVNDCAAALKELIEGDFAGVINISSRERISKCDFAVGLAGIFSLDKKLIQPVKNSQMAGWEMRPPDVSLNCAKAKKHLKKELPNIKSGLEKLKMLGDNDYLSDFRVI